MKQRARKFAGIWLMLALLLIYPAIAVAIYSQFLGWLPIWATLAYLAVAGMAWALPAGVIIKWMLKPDETA
ncbi:MAG: DUF2842 domain-containing protein [Alphaproteobacteria bacterium]|nr:DUF2842 domain-containing protein [Alphaproteobacteria bacterium]